MATKVLIFYNSSDTTGQGALVKEISRLKYDVASATITVKDIKGLSAANIISYIGGLSTGTYNDVVISCTVDGRYMTNDIVALCDSLLITANKGTSVLAGTCRANATVTEIILSVAASGDDDAYNGMFVKTAGTTAIYRYITDYVGTTATLTCATTTTAITTTETFVVYTNAHVHVVGDASSNKNACMVAWDYFFPDFVAPMVVKLMGGYGSGFAAFTETNQTATSVATATSGVGTLTHTSHFTADDYVNRWVGIESATLGTGEVHQIAANTVTLLTFNTKWRTSPTGTIKYQICDQKEWCLANMFMPLAIATYLQKEDAETRVIWGQLLDRYNAQGLGNVKQHYRTNEELLKTYLQRGQCIFDAKAYSVVS